jgi:hypothetical protein
MIQLAALDYDPIEQPMVSAGARSDGILVRRTVPYGLTISALVYNFDGNKKGELQTPLQTVFLPDTEHDYVLSIDRTPLVSNTTKISLVSGMVQSHEELRPSIIMGVVGVPKSILSALVPIPLQIRQQQQAIADAVDKRLNDQADIKKLQGP